jgi:tRNA-dihydrouridine synthase 1
MDQSKKLTGYDWYRSIGSPKYIVAPMVDQSDLPYRILCRRYGADLCYSQMLNVQTFIDHKHYRESNCATLPNRGEKPFIVQLAGHDPEKLLKVGREMQDCCDAIDINLGCPQGIARRGRYGAFLMEELDLLKDMVSTLAEGLDVPVTCKTRIYHDVERSIKLCETLVNAGASLLTIHGRTRNEKGEWTGPANWDTLKKIKEHFAGRVPIIANGGIGDMDDVERCLDYTGCDGVMSSEGVLENPALFCRNIDSHGNFIDQVRLAREYIALAKVHHPRCVKIPRAHVMKFLFRYNREMTDIRDLCHDAMSLDALEEAVDLVASRVGNNHAAYMGRGKTWYTRHVNAAHSCAGRVRAVQREIMQAERRKQLATEAWKNFEADGEDQGEEWGGIFAGLGMAME